MCACSDGETVTTPCVDPTPSTMMIMTTNVVMATTTSNIMTIVQPTSTNGVSFSSPTAIQPSSQATNVPLELTPSSTILLTSSSSIAVVQFSPTSTTATTTSSFTQVTISNSATSRLLSITSSPTAVVNSAVTTPSIGGTGVVSSSGVLIITTISMQSSPTSISVTPTSSPGIHIGS